MDHEKRIVKGYRRWKATDREKLAGRDMKSQTERMTYSIEEVARLLGIGRNQAYEAAKRGDFPVIKVGKRLLAPKPALDRMLMLNTESPQTPAAISS
jgi:excisionase family DNA binding protein